MKKLLFLILFFPPLLWRGAGGKVLAQSTYSANYFRPPLDTALELSGNFGELRNNHFHYGLDFRTGNHEGMNVLAAASGYVSRIKVSAWGYGKVLYITHPNGCTTVYGHLSSFSGAIGDYVKKKQYEKESFDIELFPDSGSLAIKKGDVIALSGNTGQSSGPHLHFEIRDSGTEEIINPLHFGINIPDTVKPELVTLAIYPLDQNAMVNGRNEPKLIPILNKAQKYFLKYSDTLWLSGNIGFGIECYDGENNPKGGRDGVYSIELKTDTQLIYHYQIDRYSFDQSRYVNAHIDYPLMKEKSKPIQKSFLSKCNRMPVYAGTANNGSFYFSEDKKYVFTYIIKDYNGNLSTLDFSAKGIAQWLNNPPLTKTINCDSAFAFSNGNITAIFQPGSFYEDLNFTYGGTPDKIPGTFSPLHELLNENIPLHYPCLLTLKTDVPSNLESKALIAYVDGKNRKIPQGGDYSESFITTKTFMLGKFTVIIDTTPPKLEAKNIKKAAKMMKEERIEIKAADNISGIKSWRATLQCVSDETPPKWVLVEYEPKKELLYYTFDWKPNNPEGKIGGWKHYIFEMEVTDSKGNASKLKYDFSR